MRKGKKEGLLAKNTLRSRGEVDGRLSDSFHSEVQSNNGNCKKFLYTHRHMEALIVEWGNRKLPSCVVVERALSLSEILETRSFPFFVFCRRFSISSCASTDTKVKSNGSTLFCAVWKESMAFYRFRIWCNARSLPPFVLFPILAHIPDAYSRVEA